jgi:hypothetical protein
MVVQVTYYYTTPWYHSVSLERDDREPTKTNTEGQREPKSEWRSKQRERERTMDDATCSDKKSNFLSGEEIPRTDVFRETSDVFTV